MGIHIKIFNDEKWAIAKTALEAAGHEVVSDVESHTAKLWANVKDAYPDIVASIEKGIADVKDSTLSGGDKAVKVATDVMAIVPEALKDLPGLKDLLVHGVSEVFADTISDLKDVAVDLIHKI
jgi:hypothetical protein